MNSRRSLSYAACVVGFVVGCSSEPTNQDLAGTTVGPGMTPATAGGAATQTPISPGSTPTMPGPDSTPVMGSPVMPLTPPTVGTQSPTPSPTGMEIPCDVATIASDHCAACHSASPRAGALMPLMTLAHFHAAGRSDPSKKVYTLASARVNHAEVARKMPPPGTVAALEAGELRTFTQWLDAGATGVASGCPVVDPESKPTTETGTVVTPPPAGAGAFLQPYQGWDEGVECFNFVAYAAGNKASKYMVGTAVDTYVGFGFKPTWEGTRYVRAFKLVRDNAEVLHHWLFFEQASAMDGNVQAQVGVHPDGQLLHGWAPGGGDLYFSKDIGIEMSSTKNYLLEIHYNSNNATAQDASGLQVCVTKEPPTNKTTLSWLGTDAISSTSATGTCDPAGNQRIHIVAGTPHMHLKGTHMKVVVNRANGMKETVHDEPFGFENQRVYPEDLWIEPGDTITTTCTYNQPATFGPGTNEEMCYWFAMHYPTLALVDNGPIGTVIHGPNVCLGL